MCLKGVIANLVHIPQLQLFTKIGIKMFHSDDLKGDQYQCVLLYEFVDGISLDTFIHRDFARTSLDQRMHITRHLLEALNLLHSKQIAHLDIKPENIMIRPNGTILFVDVGQMSYVTQTYPAGIPFAHLAALTPLYAAPNVILSKSFTDDKHTPHPEELFAADVFAMGLTLYELFTGMKGMRQLANIGNAPSVTIRNLITYAESETDIKLKYDFDIPAVPKAIQDLILGMVYRDPARRLTAKMARDIFLDYRTQFARARIQTIRSRRTRNIMNRSRRTHKSKSKH